MKSIDLPESETPHTLFRLAVALLLQGALRGRTRSDGWTVQITDSSAGSVDWVISPEISVELNGRCVAAISSKETVAHPNTPRRSDLVWLLQSDIPTFVVTSEHDPVLLTVLTYGSAAARAVYHWDLETIREECAGTDAGVTLADLEASGRLKKVTELADDICDLAGIKTYGRRT